MATAWPPVIGSSGVSSGTVLPRPLAKASTPNSSDLRSSPSGASHVTRDCVLIGVAVNHGGVRLRFPSCSYGYDRVRLRGRIFDGSSASADV
jgi:hypothetical protein